MENEKISPNSAMTREAYIKQQKKLRRIEKKSNRAAAWKIWAIVLLSLTDATVFVIVLLSVLIRLLIG